MHQGQMNRFSPSNIFDFDKYVRHMLEFAIPKLYTIPLCKQIQHLKPLNFVLNTFAVFSELIITTLNRVLITMVPFIRDLRVFTVAFSTILSAIMTIRNVIFRSFILGTK